MGEIALAVRSLLKSKLFTAVAVITLVIGIGTTTAVFTLFNAIVIRPLPFAEQERLVDVEEWSATELCSYCAVGLSRPTFNDLRGRFTTLQSVTAYLELPMVVGGTEQPARVSAALVSGNFFSVLGVKPVLGRGLDPTDDRPGAPPVAVLSERLFHRHFGADSTLIGRQIRLDRVLTTVVGVMGPDAVMPEFAQLWVPLEPSPLTADRGARDLGVIGRLATGATVEAADAEMKVLAAGVAREHPETQKNWTGRVRLLREVLSGPEREGYAIMLGAVLVLWAIVCANLAGLLLARGVARRRELAVRLALGARRGTVIWHLLVESLCLAAVGGALGVVAASWVVELLIASLDQIPTWVQPRIDLGVLLFSVLLSLLSAVAFGLVPALRASRPDVHEDLKAGGLASVGGPKSRLRGSLVVVQLSLSLILLAAAGVLSVAMDRISARAAGTDERDVMQAEIELLGARTGEQIAATVARTVERMAAIPGARSAAARGQGFIAGFGTQDVGIRAEGVVEVPAGVSPRFYFTITPAFFATVRMTVLQGRPFTDADARGSEPVVIVNRRLADRLWPGGRAVGRRIRLGAADTLPWRTVVGIVSDIGDSAATRSNFAYVPFAQAPGNRATLLVGASGEPTALAKPMRDVAGAIDPDMPLLNLMTVEAAHRRQSAPYRAYAMAMSAFGIIALILAAIGLYGIVAFAAEQRTREIGLRIALGARRADVIRLVTQQGLRLITVGVLFGIAGSTLLVPVMRQMPFVQKPFDPLVFAVAAVLLVVVALFASYLPARRASRTDPMVALRSE